MSTDPATMAGEINDLELMVELRDKRIRQLEQQCAVLAAEIDRVRPLVEAVKNWKWGNLSALQLVCAVNDYYAIYQSSQPK